MKLSDKDILLHDTTHPHTANLMEVTMTTIGWEIMQHPPYSPEVDPRDFHWFRLLMKMHLGGQRFRTDDELTSSILN
jgi:histone-lysine N-methyltransferase SETMAR